MKERNKTIETRSKKETKTREGRMKERAHLISVWAWFTWQTIETLQVETNRTSYICLRSIIQILSLRCLRLTWKSSKIKLAKTCRYKGQFSISHPQWKNCKLGISFTIGDNFAYVSYCLVGPSNISVDPKYLKYTTFYHKSQENMT